MKASKGQVFYFLLPSYQEKSLFYCRDNLKNIHFKCLHFLFWDMTRRGRMGEQAGVTELRAKSPTLYCLHPPPAL